MVHYVQNISESSLAFFRKSFTHSSCRIFPDRFFHMEIMSGHIHIRVSRNALNRLHRDAQCLHLGNECMPAGMWRQHTDTLYCSDCFLKELGKIGRIAGRAGFLGGFPNKLVPIFPQQPCAILHIVRYGDCPIAILGYPNFSCGSFCKSLSASLGISQHFRPHHFANRYPK